MRADGRTVAAARAGWRAFDTARTALRVFDSARAGGRAIDSARAAWRAVYLRTCPRTFARRARPDPRERGELGEELAARHLAAAGFTIVGRRVRTPHAEVDLLARDRGDLVCVEVKTSLVAPLPRPRGGLRPVAAPYRREGRLGAPQLARLARAADALARANGGRARVDRVEVELQDGGRTIACSHHRDVARTGKLVPGTDRANPPPEV